MVVDASIQWSKTFLLALGMYFIYLGLLSISKLLEKE